MGNQAQDCKCEIGLPRESSHSTNQIGQAQESIERSEITEELKKQLSEKQFASFAGKNFLPKGIGEKIQQLGQDVFDHAFGGAAGGGMKLVDFAGGEAHELILKIGHFFKFKFQPWGAVKIARGIGIAGKVLGVFGIGLEVVGQIHEEQNEEKKAALIRKNEQNIRSQFNAAATGLENYGEQFVRQFVDKALEEPVQELNQKIKKIRAEKRDKTSAYRNLEFLHDECLALIREIHQTL